MKIMIIALTIHKKLRKYKTSGYVYYKLATVTCKIHEKNYTNTMALRCKDCGDKKALKNKK